MAHVVGRTKAAKEAQHKLKSMLASAVKKKSSDKMSFWKKLGSPKYFVAPMVDQSELAYRMLTRRYGAHLCVTPMIHSRLFVEQKVYRDEAMQDLIGGKADRPLFVQFCGNDEKTLLEAAKKVQDKCDAVDLNLGCPQGIAKRGHYGAFLLEELDLLERIVRHLSSNLTVPVTCKIRLLPTRAASLKLAKTLVDAGCSLLTVHGRTKEEKKQKIGATDWETIRAIKRAVDVPVIANGGIGVFADIKRCLDATECEGVMSSEAVLENPALFDDNKSFAGKTTLQRQLQLTREYLDFAEKYPPRCLKVIRKHIMAFLFPLFMSRKDLIQRLFNEREIDDIRRVINEIEKATGDVSDRELSEKIGGRLDGEGAWYTRHRSGIKKIGRAKERTEEERKARREEKKRKKRDYRAMMKARKKERKRMRKSAAQETAASPAPKPHESGSSDKGQPSCLLA